MHKPKDVMQNWLYFNELSDSFLSYLSICLPLTCRRDETQVSHNMATTKKAQVVYREGTFEFCYSKNSAKH